MRTVGLVTGLVGLAGVVVLFLTRSKGGILALFVALAAGIAWGWRGYLGRKRAGITAAGVVLLAVFLTAQGGKTAPETDKYPMEKAQATDEKHTGWEGILGDSAEVRIQYWKASWEVFREHPILGVGPGNFADSYLAHRTPRGSETRYAHNDYVEVTVEQGLAGLVAYLAMWAIWFWCMRRDATKSEEGKADTEAEDRRSRRGFALLIGAVGVAGVLFTMNQFIPTGETWMMILVGIAAWVGVYWVQARQAVDAPEVPELRLVRGAILIGVCAFLVHSAIDFDFDVPGVMMPLAGMLAVGIALRGKGARNLLPAQLPLSLTLPPKGGGK